MKGMQRTKQACLQSKIFDLWDDLKTKKITLDNLLDGLVELNIA